MLRIAGYADRFSVHPGEDVRFHVSSEHSEGYQAEIVRLIHGDTNPAGPGYKEEGSVAKSGWLVTCLRDLERGVEA